MKTTYHVVPHNDFCRRLHLTSLENAFNEENVYYYIRDFLPQRGHFVVKTEATNVTKFLLFDIDGFGFKFKELV